MKPKLKWRLGNAENARDTGQLANKTTGNELILLEGRERHMHCKWQDHMAGIRSHIMTACGLVGRDMEL